MYLGDNLIQIPGVKRLFPLSANGAFESQLASHLERDNDRCRHRCCCEPWGVSGSAANSRRRLAQSFTSVMRIGLWTMPSPDEPLRKRQA